MLADDAFSPNLTTLNFRPYTERRKMSLAIFKTYSLFLLEMHFRFLWNPSLVIRWKKASWAHRSWAFWYDKCSISFE